MTTAGATDIPTDEVSYGRRLTELAREKPDAVDLIVVDQLGNERPVPWRELEVRANQIARALNDHGVGKDDIVALALPSCVEHIFVTLAIWKLGATLLPLRHDLPDWEMERMIAMAGPMVLVSDTHRATCVVMTRDDLAATMSASEAPLPDEISECVNLIASSGSTGLPKLIVTPSRGVVASDQQAVLSRGSNDQRALIVSPLYHVNGFAYVAPTLLEGSNVVLMEKFDAARAVELIERHQITFTVMVPTMLQRIARLPDIAPNALRSITRLMCGGAKVPEWVVDRWLELIDPSAYTFSYGSSERIGLAMMTGADWHRKRGSTGTAVACTITIRNEVGEIVPAGEVGSIHLRPLPGQRVFRYIGVPTPEPTADGAYTLGDMGWMDDEGYLYVVDRRTDMIITGGANVFPAEVETALSEHPDLLDQVVVGVADEEWGQRVHAIVQPRDPASPPAVEELRAFCKERLAGYKVPKSIEFVERVPRTEAGKLNRKNIGDERSSGVPDTPRQG